DHRDVRRLRLQGTLARRPGPARPGRGDPEDHPALSISSTRSVRRNPMRRLVVDFADRRPIFRLPGWAVDRLRAALPADWTMVTVGTLADGTGDGAGAASAEALEAVRDAEVYFGYGIAPEILRQGRGLRWVHSGTAGVAGSLTPEMRASDVVFTNSAGVHAPAMAETVLAMILHFAR